jgi:nitrous oxidase accessory protein
MNNPLMKLSSLGVIFLLLLTLNPLPCTAVGIPSSKSHPLVFTDTTIYVGGNGPGNYTRIQDAIDNASAGDTVFVYHGNYTENIMVDKSVQLLGENENSTLIDGGGLRTVVSITTSNVILRGFTIQNSKNGTQYAGVGISTASNVIIAGNIIHDNGGLGISLRGLGTSNTTIDANVIANNTYGVFLQESSEVYISNNTLVDNGEGMYLVGMSASRIITNTVMNRGLGLHLEGSFGIIVSGNSFFENKNGMYLFNTSGTTVSANTVRENRWYGIWLKDSSENTIEGNSITDNVDLGLYLDTSDDNTIRNNTLFDNDNGIYFKDSSRNLITHNNLRNDKFNADFVTYSLLRSRNIWRSNYWERLRVMPYPIFGTLKINNTPYPIINFDWTPLRQPPESLYSISGHLDGRIFYVGGNGPHNYSSIQSAIDDALVNDTVYVFNGTYYEAVLITKPLHLRGENKTTTILDGQGTWDILTVVADYVEITGFTLQNAHFDILVNHSSYDTINGNNILYSLQGVSIQNGCHFLRISNNTITDNVYGVRLFSSYEVTVSFNSFSNYKMNAFFFGTSLSQGRHHWQKNYWGNPRHLPYFIVGKIRLGKFSLIRVNCDWAPLATPLSGEF